MICTVTVNLGHPVDIVPDPTLLTCRKIAKLLVDYVRVKVVWITTQDVPPGPVLANVPGTQATCWCNARGHANNVLEVVEEVEPRLDPNQGVTFAQVCLEFP